MAGLLVSVRSVEEARAALAGGASVIDVKEPARGPLGMADGRIWNEVRLAVPAEVPVSVALGELHEWRGRQPPERGLFARIAYRKLGLARAGAGWAREWAELRAEWGDGPAWIAVIYADWVRAEAPSAEEVLETALPLQACAGVLIDTWDKAGSSPLGPEWAERLDRVRGVDKLIALAGGLDSRSIARLGPLAPDLFAVRGAACGEGNRLGSIDSDRVALLVRAARAGVPSTMNH